MMVMAKLCGKDAQRDCRLGQASCRAIHRAAEVETQAHATSQHLSTDQAEVVDPQELEQVVSRVLTGRKFFGKQVLLSLDGKVLRGTLDGPERNLSVSSLSA